MKTQMRWKEIRQAGWPKREDIFAPGFMLQLAVLPGRKLGEFKDDNYFCLIFPHN